PAFRWQFWQARLLPAKRFAAFETSGPISFGVSVKSTCPYLTSSPNGSSPTLLISGGVHCVRSIATVSAAGIRLLPVHTLAPRVETMSQIRFIAPVDRLNL